MKKFLKILKYALMFWLVLIALFLLALTINYHGFCYEKKWFASDDELIKVAVERLNNRSTVSLKRSEMEKRGLYRGNTVYPNIPYQNIDEFLAKNPGCCHVRRSLDGYKDEIPPVNIWSKIVGAHTGYAIIEYKARYEDEKGNIQTIPNKKIFSMQNCGDIN